MHAPSPSSSNNKADCASLTTSSNSVLMHAGLKYPMVCAAGQQGCLEGRLLGYYAGACTSTPAGAAPPSTAAALSAERWIVHTSFLAGPASSINSQQQQVRVLAKGLHVSTHADNQHSLAQLCCCKHSLHASSFTFSCCVLLGLRLTGLHAMMSPYILVGPSTTTTQEHSVLF